jgi:site-specific DNA-methyltransferase (adenine-specific)/modification methylase
MILDGQVNTVARAGRAVDRLARDGPPDGGSSVPGGADVAAALASRYRIIHGDCQLLVDTEIDPAAVDAVVTDPPYGINYRHSGCGSATRLGRPAYRHAEPIEGDDRPFDPGRWLEIGCPCLFVGAQNFAHLLPPGGSWLQWDKACGKGPHDSFLDGELAWCSARGIKRNVIHVLWKGVVCEKRGEDNGERSHPNQKPILLMWQCIRLMNLPPGSLILDPYMGSGSTLIAALVEGHRCVGIEIDRRHCASARDRIESFHRDPGRLAALRRALSSTLEADVK